MSFEQEVASLRAVVDAVSQPLWVIDSSGSVAHVNESAMQLLGYRSRHHLVGLSSHDALHSRREDGTPYPENECPIASDHAEPRGRLNREVFLTRSGRALPVSWTLSTLPLHRFRLLAFVPDRQQCLGHSAMSGSSPTAEELRARIARDFRSPKLTPESLAAAYHISLRTLQGIFARDQDSPAAVMRHVRLEHGRALLRGGVDSVAAALECGFRDPDTFVRAFRRAYGVTPKMYAQSVESSDYISDTDWSGVPAVHLAAAASRPD